MCLYSFSLLLNISGKHVRVKDEEEAVAGAADRVRHDFCSDSGGQGVRFFDDALKEVCLKLNGFVNLLL